MEKEGHPASQNNIVPAHREIPSRHNDPTSKRLLLCTACDVCAATWRNKVQSVTKYTDETESVTGHFVMSSSQVNAPTDSGVRQYLQHKLPYTTHAQIMPKLPYTTLSFCLTRLFSRRLLQFRASLHRSSKEPLGTGGARFLQAGYHSCHPNNSVKALKKHK